ncbi:MAG: DegT/DnrJ/EryC1/StrS family aminotransferase [Spirochaetaceae bacterium]|jgi:dTDP-4-amino-4,6-dideoxygalactose transaminase|nr:DegT/DnrJ/EryC1/StrS family aminotransferase [Spirochaetaceae bacterium]
MKVEVYSPTIRRKEMDAVLTAMVEDKIGPGEQSRLLIQVAKEHLGFEHCLALRSPVLALALALKSLNLEDGAGVVLSALSPRYYVQVLEDLRLKPVYADVSPSFPCIDRETLEQACKREEASPKAIVAHNTLGFVPDMDVLAQMGLPLIEDRSQSYGTPGSSSSVSAFILLGLEERDMLTSGGGALLYGVQSRSASVLRNKGELPPEYGLPDMNAAMAVVQFREGAKNLAKRKGIAQIYTQSALRTRHKRFIPRDEEGYNQYAFPLILETGMKEVKAYAKRKDIAVANAFEGTLMGSGLVEPALCPESYSLSLRTVLFPLYPRLGVTETEKVAKLIASLP